jgi:hypothetical protein
MAGSSPPPAGPAQPPAQQWRREWETALNALEIDVSAAEALLTDDQRLRERPVSDPWHPPAGLGPLPLDLRPRADAILTRQLAVAEAVAGALVTNRRQAALLGRMKSGPQARPAYVDCAM